MAGLQARIVMTEDTLMPRLMTLDSLIRKGVQATVTYYEPIAEARMKERAPWTDRTGNARNGLAARSRVGDDEFSLILFHQVPYGIYLETKNGGKYAVIMPVARDIGKDMMKTINKMLGSLGVQGRATIV